MELMKFFFFCRFEDEMLKKADLENEFILTKKVSRTFSQGCHFYLNWK